MDNFVNLEIGHVTWNSHLLIYALNGMQLVDCKSPSSDESRTIRHDTGLDLEITGK
jgi:hypothetical protein